MSTIDNSIREFAALVKQQQARLNASAAAVPGGRLSTSATFAIGARVLDLLSGEKGTVIDAKRSNVVVPSA